MNNKNLLLKFILDLLAIPSPTGMTEEASKYVCQVLKEWEIPYAINRRGTITAKIKGKKPSEAKALIVHLDTLGLIVTRLKDNGRLAIREVGYLTPRMIEGTRVTVHTKKGKIRGTVQPLKTSNHVHDHEPIMSQPNTWDNLEIRIDENVFSKLDLVAVGVDVGDIISIDTSSEVTPTGFIVSRFLDNTAGTSCLLTAVHELICVKATIPHDIYLIFTVNEEVDGSGARFVPDAVSEVLAIDIAPVDAEQASSEYACTIGVKDSEMLYDRQLISKMVKLCESQAIKYRLDVFHNLSSDVHNVISMGKDVLTGYIGFGADSSHAYERTHVDSLTNLVKLIKAYALSK